MSNPWLRTTRLPNRPRAALAALHLGDPRTEGLRGLTDSQWRETLEYCGRSQIALIFGRRVREFMPAWVRDIADTNQAHNLQRLRVIEELYASIDGCLASAGVEFLALKGLTQCSLFGIEPAERAQYDLDLYTPQTLAAAARDALLTLGLEPIEGMDAFPTDHLPALIRKTGWQYRGDVFDPEMPLAVEVHFRFWNPALERLPAPGVEEFWDRRVVRQPLGVPALAPPDALAYACLHLLKHVLRGSARPFHVYEVACFLHSHAADDDFWRTWRSLHSPGLRRLEAVAFRLAAEWFGCEIGPAGEEIAQLPAAAAAWFGRFALSPAAVPFDANKDELWLHLSLLESSANRFAVARRRLFPARLPAAVDGVYVPSGQMNWRMRTMKNLRWSGYVAKRLVRHARSLPAVIRSGVRWWWGLQETAPSRSRL